MQNLASWNLDRRGSQLCWDNCSLAEIAGKHGTPLYVVNLMLVQQAHDALAGAFNGAGLEARFFFSYKTNPIPDVLKAIAALGCGAEIISEFEFWLAAQIGVAGCDMVVNGSLKSPELLRQAVAQDVALINVESVDEIRRLQKIAGELGRPVNTGLRINPCLSKSPFDFTLSAGSRKSHIGFTPQDGRWQEALDILRGDALLKLRGLHFHIGSGVRAAAPYRAALKSALKMWTDLLEKGFRPEVLDIGGGFGTATLKELSLSEAVRFIGWGRPATPPARPMRDNLLQQIARACAAELNAFTRRRGTSMPAVYVEPGRALVSSSQLLLLTVVAVRKRTDGTNVAVCDAGALSLSPLLLSEQHRVVVANKPEGGQTARYDIVGNLPAPLDWVALRQELPVLEPGDILAVMDAGAYFTSLGNNFGGPRPAIVTIADGVPRLARRREVFEDMVSRDLSMRTGRKTNEGKA